MEIGLFMIIIVFLIVINSKLNTKLEDVSFRMVQLESIIKKLKITIEETKRPLEEAPIEKLEEKRAPQEEVVAPRVEVVEKPKPDIVQPIIEEPKKVAAEKVVTNYNSVSEKVKQPIVIEDTSTYWSRFKENNPDLEKFVGENLINKIGILILILGITFFIKFSIDKNWINEWGRVGIGMLAGAIVFSVAHYLRNSYKAFSSVLVAGSIVIFYFAIYIAFQHYHLFSQTVAFIILVLITALSILVSISYNRQELAILSLVGGFVVPFLVSTGDGNYKVLFSYILLLNAGVLIVSILKNWSLCGIVSFVLSALLFNVYLHTDGVEHSEKLIGMFIFAVLFYVLFLIYSIVSTSRNKNEFNKANSAIFTANTFLFFSQGITILDILHPDWKGMFTIGLGLINFAIGWLSYYRLKLHKTTIYMFLGLCMMFVTLAIPIQFEGFWVTIFWSFEAVFILWLWTQTEVKSLVFTSVVVYFLSIYSLLYYYTNCFASDDFHNIIFNTIFITGLSVILALLAGYIILKDKNETIHTLSFKIETKAYSQILLPLAVILGYVVGMIEIVMQAHQHQWIQVNEYSLMFSFHFAYTTVLAYYILKTTRPELYKLGTTLIYFNGILFLAVAMSLPFKELEQSCYGFNYYISWFLNYFILACIACLFTILLRFKEKDEEAMLFSSKVQTYLMSFFIVILTSAIAMYHAMRIGLYNYGFTIERYDELYSLYFKIVLPVLWGLLSLTFIFVGIKKQWRNLRIIGLILLAITILKLFIWDISTISEIGKIITFILLGVLILFISFKYQKIRKIISEEPKKTEEND